MVGCMSVLTGEDSWDVYGDSHERQWHGGEVLSRTETTILHDAYQLPGTYQPLSVHARQQETVSNNTDTRVSLVKFKGTLCRPLITVM